MTVGFQFTQQAIKDIDSIWQFIAGDNKQAADLVEAEFIATCRRLAQYPSMGTKRQDITSLPVRFWTVTKYPNYVIVYRPETTPLQVVAVLHSRQRLKDALEGKL
ncbi:MAG TPA: type II toxin-antitoxin system RelE/ParE family toxin [Terriglobia bacterium]|nr:type II toxin-antitoxin system RelE/ParE family toxin [Terriglobia bacterium]